MDTQQLYMLRGMGVWPTPAECALREYMHQSCQFQIIRYVLGIASEYPEVRRLAICETRSRWERLYKTCGRDIKCCSCRREVEIVKMAQSDGTVGLAASTATWYITPCGHAYHSACINKRFSNVLRCPKCQYNYTPMDAFHEVLYLHPAPPAVCKQILEKMISLDTKN